MSITTTFLAPSVATYYAVLRPQSGANAGKVWNTSTPGYEAWNDSNVANYGIALSRQGTSLQYVLTLPSGADQFNPHDADLYVKAGANFNPLAAGDVQAGSGSIGGYEQGGALPAAAQGQTGGLAPLSATGTTKSEAAAAIAAANGAQTYYWIGDGGTNSYATKACYLLNGATPANLPVAGDTLIVNPNTAGYVADPAAGTLRCDATFNNTSNGGIISGNATFDGGNNNVSVSGNATFNDSVNGTDGTVSGNAIFNGSSYTQGTISGNATFNDTAGNSGTVSGNATFNDSSANDSTVSGDATFNTSVTPSGIVSGNAYLARDYGLTAAQVQTAIGCANVFFLYSNTNAPATNTQAATIISGQAGTTPLASGTVSASPAPTTTTFTPSGGYSGIIPASGYLTLAGVQYAYTWDGTEFHGAFGSAPSGEAAWVVPGVAQNSDASLAIAAQNAGSGFKTSNPPVVVASINLTPAQATLAGNQVGGSPIQAYEGYALINYNQSFNNLDGTPANWLNGLTGHFKVFTPETEVNLFTPISFTFVENVAQFTVRAADNSAQGPYRYEISYTDSGTGDPVLIATNSYAIGDGGTAP